MPSLGSNAHATHNRRILVIDDNHAIHDDFRKILDSVDPSENLVDAESAFFGETAETMHAELDVEIDSAYQGQEGLQKVVAAIKQGLPYAMAFVDMRMPPGWDGLTTIERLWEVAPDLQIVICSAYSDDSWADICKRLGRSDRLLILKKPFDNAEVCQLTLALTEKWNLAQQAKMKQNELEELVDERTRELEEKDTVLRQKHKLEAVGELAGGVAHEFNNLLQAIRGYACFAREDVPPDGQVHEDLGHVVEATDRASAIASQLLSFSRQKPSEKSLVTAAEIGKLTLEMIHPLLPANVEVDFDFCSEPMFIHADPDLLTQALLNLCINARDAMSMGGRLRIGLHEAAISACEGIAASSTPPSLAPGRYAVFSIEDTGCGMSKEIQERIFEPFFTTKEVGKGTGMGLAIVFSTLQEIDGRVTVESKEGLGATFQLYLPVSSAQAGEIAPMVDGLLVSKSFGSETLLLAEDDEMVRAVASRLLRQAGYRVIESCDGEDAMAKFQEYSDSIEVAVLDVVMPRATGIEVAEYVRSINREAKVIFCTGYNPDDVFAKTRKDLPLRIIQKPIESATLLSVVRQALDEVAVCPAC